MVRLLTVVVCSSLFCGGSLYAQITGQLRGSAVDASGGTVNSAKITLTNRETGQVRDKAVNAQGEFAFDLLQVGTYEVRAEPPGFAASIATAPVGAGETATVNLKLEIGQTKQTVK